MSLPSPVQLLLERLEEFGCEPRPCGRGWKARCPAHDDRKASLSSGIGDEGRALVTCHAGCEAASVLSAVNLTLRDLMPEDHGYKPSCRNGPRGGGVNTPLVPKTPALDSAKGGFGDGDGGDRREVHYPTAEDAVAELERRHGPRSYLWRYHNAAGEPVGVVVRWDRGNGDKDVRPAARFGSDWVLRGMPTPRPLYGLPKLLAVLNDDTVYVTEGEKAADAVRACGLIATTSPHGAGSAAKADWSPLAGHDVVFLPDLDDAGEKYANDVASLVANGLARTVRVVQLADRWGTLPKGGDAADVLEIEGGDAEAVRSGIEALAVEAEAIETERADPPACFTPFPVDMLPEPVGQYVSEAAKAIGCDPCYVALPMLAGLARAIGNTHLIELKQTWNEPAILWFAIVGESGTAKSPAMEMALRPVKEHQHRAIIEHERAMKEWESKHACWEVEYASWKKRAMNGEIGDPPGAPEKPVCPRTWTDDTTTEALVARLKDNPRGLIMVRDELAGWFDFGRYTYGKGGGDVAR